MKSSLQLKLHDAFLLSIMALLAACGLIYEYLISHFAGRVIGILETAIFLMIGLMIVFMGLGAIAARWIKDHFMGFVVVELCIAFVGAMGIIVVSVTIGLVKWLPEALASYYGVDSFIFQQGQFFAILLKIAQMLPYVIGAFLGFAIGMEIPLIGRIRESIYEKHLKHNMGTIYGADYIGAGLGAVVWVFLLLKIDLSLAAAITATLNLIVGLIFLIVYRTKIKYMKRLIVGHLLVFLCVCWVGMAGDANQNKFLNFLYRDQVILNEHTPFQEVVLTRIKGEHAHHALYLNGRLQFNSSDEQLYHGFLVNPAMLLAPEQARVLVIGGGDGLAVRDLLTWNPASIDLVDIDEKLVSRFKDDLTLPFVVLNKNALNDKRVTLHYQDAFLFVDQLYRQQRQFDVIIMDLPDPNHPDLNKLYSIDYFQRLKKLLTKDGVFVTQSTSPYHARRAFICIKKTLEATGYADTQQYHANIPSFGEWGWTIATLKDTNLKASIMLRMPEREWENDWFNAPFLLSAFNFPTNFYDIESEIEINFLGSHKLYRYHFEDWQQSSGLALYKARNKNNTYIE